MRSKANWQPAEHGVLVYQPAPHVSVEDTEYALSDLSFSDTDGSGKCAQSQESQVDDTVLPSCELVEVVRVKAEPIDPDSYRLSRGESEETLVGGDDDILAKAVSVAMATPDSSASVDFLAQLHAAAGRGSCISGTSSPSPLPRQTSPTFQEEYIDVGYDFERTNFLEQTPTPSVRENRGKRAPATRKTSHHFRQVTRLLTKKPLARRLDFGAAKRKPSVKVVKRSTNAQALENLRSLELHPKHNWDDDERELLCVLNRWYCAPDRATELKAFSKTFNAITGLGLRPHIVRDQFEQHLRLYGPESYLVYGRVFSTPFDDPEGRYKQIRRLIEDEAAHLQLDLRRRQIDIRAPPGTARFTKSPNIREKYKSLARRASRYAKAVSDQRSLTEAPAAPSIFGNMSKAVQIPIEDDWELVTDIESSPEPVIEPVEVSEAASTRPHLVFRVWDAASRTKFIDGSFIAQAFMGWPRPYPSPVPLKCPSEVGKILAVLHLSKQGDTPCFISTASSLLQAISYATSMQSPQLALIDLDAPCLQIEHKLHHAAEVFPWLKSQGLARWARYKGNGEYFVWSDIPQSAVLHTLDLDQLMNDLNADEDCQDLLNFDLFEPGMKTNAIAALLRERNSILNTETARALGKIARCFGMSQQNISLKHLEDFIARVMDGWTIQKPFAVDMHTTSSLAFTFATEFGSHADGYTVQDVMGAFMDGVEQGTRCIAHWSRSRSGTRRSRFREA